MRLLDVEAVLEINERHSDLGLSDYRSLLSALQEARPMTFGRPIKVTVHHQAGAMLRGIVLNKPFADGNKRTAVDAVFALYELNGAVFSPPPRLSFFVERLATATLPEIAAWLSQWSVLPPTEEAEEVVAPAPTETMDWTAGANMRTARRA